VRAPSRDERSACSEHEQERRQGHAVQQTARGGALGKAEQDEWIDLLGPQRVEREVIHSIHIRDAAVRDEGEQHPRGARGGGGTDSDDAADRARTTVESAERGQRERQCADHRVHEHRRARRDDSADRAGDPAAVQTSSRIAGVGREHRGGPGHERRGECVREKADTDQEIPRRGREQRERPGEECGRRPQPERAGVGGDAEGAEWDDRGER